MAAARAAVPGTAAAAGAGAGVGVGGRSSPSLSAGSKLRSASITGLGGGGCVSGIVSAELRWRGGSVSSELRMRVQGTGLALDCCKAWTGEQEARELCDCELGPISRTGPRSHTISAAAVTILVSVGPDWVRPMSDVLVCRLCSEKKYIALFGWATFSCAGCF